MNIPSQSLPTEADVAEIGTITARQSTWANPLPADEIERHERVRARLRPGMTVSLDGLGDFIYSGLWDTMHSFYPASGQNLLLIWGDRPTRYLKRDMRGEHYLQIPYTRLADFVRFV